MKRNHFIQAFLLLLTSISFSGMAHSDTHGGHNALNHGPETHQANDGSSMREAPKQTESHGEWAHGQVRRINKALGKITLRHGFLKSIDMPPMTMVFTMRDPSALDTLNVGDPVEFTVTKNSEGQLIVTDIRVKETSERPVP